MELEVIKKDIGENIAEVNFEDAFAEYCFLKYGRLHLIGAWVSDDQAAICKDKFPDVYYRELNNFIEESLALGDVIKVDDSYYYKSKVSEYVYDKYNVEM